MESKVLFYPVWISNTGRKKFLWGKPCDTPSEAKNIGKAEYEAGRATMSFVVEFSGGVKRPIPGYTYPGSARTIILHWEELMDATE